MPYYEYICDKGHEFEVEQPITEDPLTKCDSRTTISVEQRGQGLRVKQRVCNAPCHRLLSKSSVVLKGGGWSGDGYAKSGKGETR